MNLPFGLDLKSIVVGILLAYFIIPRIMGLWASRKTEAAV